MNIIIIIFSGILGLIIGSFLNVVIFRMNTGRGIGGRSMCLSCNHVLKWYELIPVASFVIQGGKCRNCKSKISPQYPLVEFFTGILFAVAAGFTLAHAGFAILLPLAFIFTAFGIVLAVYDIRHQMIHLPTLLGMFAFGFLIVAAQYFFAGHPIGVRFFVHAIESVVLVALPFFILWAVSRGAWIGFGDIEILAVAGFLLGISGGYSATFLGFWIACACVLPAYAVARMRKKNQKSDHRVALGPFLILGMYVVLICGFNFVRLLVRA